MAKEQKDITTLDVQIAEFIRSHKKSGTATDDEINDQLVIQMGLKIFCNVFKMQEFPSRIKMVTQVRVC